MYPRFFIAPDLYIIWCLIFCILPILFIYIIDFFHTNLSKRKKLFLIDLGVSATSIYYVGNSNSIRSPLEFWIIKHFLVTIFFAVVPWNLSWPNRAAALTIPLLPSFGSTSWMGTGPRPTMTFKSCSCYWANRII